MVHHNIKKIIYFKNIETGETISFRSQQECADHFNIDRKNVGTYLYKKLKFKKVWAQTNSKYEYLYHDVTKQKGTKAKAAITPQYENFLGETKPLANHNIISLFEKCLEEKDFIRFCGYCKFYSGSAKKHIFFPHSSWNEAQKEFEQNRCGKDVIVKPRRVGMTTIELCRDLFFALTNPGAMVFVVAQSESTTKELKRLIWDIIRNFKDLEKTYGYQFIPDCTQNSQKIIQFDSGSIIQFETAKNKLENAQQSGRGMTISRLHCTEVTYYAFPQETMTSLLEAANDANEIVIESTPQGAQGWFYEHYMKVDSGTIHGWKNHFFPWFIMKKNMIVLDPITKASISMIPENQHEEYLINEIKISPEQLFWWRDKVQNLKIDKALQEHPINTESCFSSKGGSYLSTEDYEYLKKNIEDPMENKIFLDQQVDIFRYPKNPAEKFVLGMDTSSGTGGDFSTICVIDRMEGKIVAAYESNTILISKFAVLAIQIAKFFNNAQIVCERNNSGVAVIQRIEEEGYYHLYKEIDKDKYGVWTNAQTRLSFYIDIQEIIKGRTPHIQYRKIFEEVTKLVIKNNRIDHSRTGHDDNLIAFALAHYGRKNMQVMGANPYISAGSSKVKFNRIGNLGFSLR